MGKLLLSQFHFSVTKGTILKSFLCVMLLCLLTVTGFTAPANVTLVQNGAAKSVIYVAPEVMAPDKKIHYAAPEYSGEVARLRLQESVKDLSLYLGKMSGAKVEVLTTAPAATDKRLPILVGALATKQFGAPAKKSPYKQGWRMVVSPKGVGFLGESDEATSYAIYEMLDRLGCRWFLPGEMGEDVPSLKTIALPAVDISEVPATVSRLIWYADEAFKRRNRQGGMSLSATHALEVHSGDQYGYLTRQQLEANLDWNAEIGGKRSVNGRFCWANPEVAVAVADSIIAQLDKQYTPTVSLSPEDGATFCQCAKCKALDAGDWDTTMNEMSITDRYVQFCNQIAERVTKKHPNVLFGFLAYVQYTRPPVREKVHPNLVPEIAPITYCRAHSMTDPNCESRQKIRHIVEGWGKKAQKTAYYNYMFHLAEVAVPYPMMKQMSDELPIIYKNNLTFWQPETMPNFESVLPGFYLSIRKSWHTQAQPAAILNEFFTRFYGSAEKPMRRYWQTFDDAWNKVPEHAGCGFGYGVRFTPAVLKDARTAMNEALTAAATPVEYQRVKIQDESLRQFERFMQLRWDLFEGKLANLDLDATRWSGAQLALGDEYAENSAFSRVGWTPHTIGGAYFNAFFKSAYTDGARIARDFTIISPSLRKWRYAVDRDKKGAESGWSTPAFDDKEWKTTDPTVDTWFALGLHGYYGTMWYRDRVQVPAVPEGKKVYLWISSTDGAAKVFVNGQHVPYINAKGEKVDEFNGFCEAASFDITSAVKPNAENQITIAGTRNFLNELGTGGLLGPVMLYREK